MIVNQAIANEVKVVFGNEKQLKFARYKVRRHFDLCIRKEYSMNNTKQQEEKISLKGWISLIILVIMFSGIFKDAPGFLKAFDFTNLVGKFGSMGEGAAKNFIGMGGSGAREGFMQALSLIPSVSFAIGLIDIVTDMGGLRAAAKMFQPILKPLMGIPGICGLSFVSTFTSSDIGAVMTKDLYEDGLITDKERSIYCAYQYAGSAVILNTINTQAPLLPIVLFSTGPIILILFLFKILGANLVRLVLTLQEKKAGVKSNG